MKKKIEPIPVPAKPSNSQRGKYVYKPIISIIVVCSCGNKYVKTRDRQTVCIRCIQNR